MKRNELRVALDWEVDDIDPPCSFGGWNTSRVVQQIFNSLVEDDLDSEQGAVTSLMPALAQSHNISADGLTYSFTLRKNVFFHDGAVCDADAIRMNVERMWDRSSAHFSERAFDLNRMAVDLLAGVRVINPRQIELTLHQPFAEFLRYMTQEDSPGSFVFVSPDYIRAGRAAPAPGTGPYALAKRFDTVHGSAVQLKRFEGYWGQPAATEYIEFKPIPSADGRAEALLSGAADIAYGPAPAALERLAELGFIIAERPVPYVWYFAINMRERRLNDVRVRRAVLHAIDRNRMSKELFGSATTPVNGLVPPASPSFEPDFPDLYPYDPAYAKSLLNEAGITGRFPLKLNVARAGSGQLEPVAISEYLRRDLEKIGIDVEVIIDDDWVAYCEAWRLGLPSGMGASEMSWGMSCDVWLEQVLHSRNHSPNGFNTGYYENAEVDRLLDLAKQEMDEAKRIALYRKAHRLIMHDAPVIPLLTIQRGLVVHSPRVGGLRFPPQNWHNLAGAWVEQD